MTDQPETVQGLLPLPGLEAPAGRSGGALEAAVRRTLASLHADGHLVERDAGKIQLALELAQVVTVKRATGRASTIGNDARVLMEILDSFTADAADDEDGSFEAMVRGFEEMAERERAAEAAAQVGE